MKTRMLQGLWLACAVLALGSCQTAQEGLVSEPTSAKMGSTPEFTEEEMMARMMELATPGPAHKVLEPLVGDWTCEVEMAAMDPSMPAQVTAGKSTNRWILGGRFIETRYEGDMMGQTFSGKGIMGFNNAEQKYESVWIDSMSTFIMPVSQGTADASGTVIELHRKADVMGMGAPSTMREVWTIIDNNSHTFQLFSDRGPGTEEYLAMTVRYKRVGS